MLQVGGTGSGLLPNFRCVFLCKLLAVQVVVVAALFEEVQVFALLHDFAVPDHQNEVCLPDGGEAVGNEEGGAVPEERGRWRPGSAARSGCRWRRCASSRTKIRGLASTARAKEISCFSPVESRSPPSPTSLSQPFSSLATTVSAETARAAASTSSSVASRRP